MSKKKEEPRNFTKERDVELAPIARTLLLALSAREDLMMGSNETVTVEDALKYYQEKVVSVILPVLIKQNVKIEDVPYIFQLMSQPVNFVKDITVNSFAMNRAIADANLYGVKDISELRVNELDNKLKEFAKKNEDDIVK